MWDQSRNFDFVHNADPKLVRNNGFCIFTVAHTNMTVRRACLDRTHENLTIPTEAEDGC